MCVTSVQLSGLTPHRPLQQALAQVDDLRLVSVLELCVNTHENSLGNFGESPSPCTPSTVMARPCLKARPAQALPTRIWSLDHCTHRPALHPTLQGLITLSRGPGSTGHWLVGLCSGAQCVVWPCLQFPVGGGLGARPRRVPWPRGLLCASAPTGCLLHPPLLACVIHTGPQTSACGPKVPLGLRAAVGRQGPKGTDASEGAKGSRACADLSSCGPTGLHLPNLSQLKLNGSCLGSLR